MHEEILRWLKKSGYPLEMQVATELLNSKITSFVQSDYYLDPESGKMREIDFKIRLSDETGFCLVYACIECKHTNKPWIIFQSKNSYDGDLFSFCIYSEFGRNKLANKLLPESLQTVLNWEWFRPKKHRLGYGAAEAFADKADKIDKTYEARMSCIKAALAEKIFLDKGHVKKLSFIFPVIVIDTNLYEIGIDDSNELDIVEVESGIVYSPFLIDGFIGSNVHIIPIKNFAKFINDFKQQANNFFSIFKPDIEHLSKDLHSEGLYLEE